MGGTGLENTADSSGKTPISETGGAESGAVSAELPPDLAKIVAAWPNLPEPIRRAMLALVGANDHSNPLP
jgi:hypothetical protein